MDYTIQYYDLVLVAIVATMVVSASEVRTPTLALPTAVTIAGVVALCSSPTVCSSGVRWTVRKTSPTKWTP